MAVLVSLQTGDDAVSTAVVVSGAAGVFVAAVAEIVEEEAKAVPPPEDTSGSGDGVAGAESDAGESSAIAAIDRSYASNFSLAALCCSSYLVAVEIK